VVGDEPKPTIQTVVQLLYFIGKMLWRPMTVWMAPWKFPSYSTPLSMTDAASLACVLKLVESGRLKMPLHDNRSFPFTEAGVREALSVQAGGHAHGKVVVKIADVA